MGDQALRLGQEASAVEQPRAHASLDALHQHAVLGADLVVECEEVGDPLVVSVLGDEVVEEAVGSLGANAGSPGRSTGSACRA